MSSNLDSSKGLSITSRSLSALVLCFLLGGSPDSGPIWVSAVDFLAYDLGPLRI